MSKTDTTWKTLALCSISAMAGMLFVVAYGAGPGAAEAAGSASAAGSSPVIAYVADADHNGDGRASGDDYYNLKGKACPKGWTYLGWRDPGRRLEAVCMLN